MSKYYVSAVRIENVVFTTDFYSRAETIKSFLSSRAPAKETFPVKGWKFPRVYLTHGTQENGEGWAFHK